MHFYCIGLEIIQLNRHNDFVYMLNGVELPSSGQIVELLSFFLFFLFFLKRWNRNLNAASESTYLSAYLFLFIHCLTFYGKLSFPRSLWWKSGWMSEVTQVRSRTLETTERTSVMATCLCAHRVSLFLLSASVNLSALC